MGRKKYTYMAVTADEFELPIMLDDSLRRLAERLGIAYNTAQVEVYRENSGRYKGYKIVKVRIDIDDDDDDDHLNDKMTDSLR